jgi:hypothetical protein
MRFLSLRWAGWEGNIIPMGAVTQIGAIASVMLV